ncbi:MAG: sigma-54-dependent Fis family transcriptional regulator [Alphaproteobacteria bacterium]|nr:sigma-54-dependent Fis family transcriptional regulator [Alphaproteobacteria bacterium]
MRLLIVGTMEGPIAVAGKIAHQRGAKVSHIDTISGAMNVLRSGQGIDLVMVDVRCDVADLINQIKLERINVPTIACGIGNDAEAAVRAIKAGAKEYIPLPPDAELIAAVLQAVTEESHNIISGDPAMKAVIDMAEKVAPSAASVLITGESGTGKEVLARHIHRKSNRSAGNFVAVNCAAIPDNLLESELFGHEKGAFTGAVARRLGKFEEANGGTLLLDEMSEMDMRLQAKLLRALQEREIDRVGGNQPIKVDVRIIATSNRNMEEEVRNKRFREDLYFRLNVMSIRIPTLRERPLDIKPLSEFFAAKFAEANGFPNKVISPAALQSLQSHHWRGNVRELENTMHRAVLMSSGDMIEAEAVTLSGQSLNMPDANGMARTAQSIMNAGVPGGSMVGKTVADVERDLIIDTLQHCLGNRTHAATILGISIRTLRNKLKEYTDKGLNIPMPGETGRANIG